MSERNGICLECCKAVLECTCPQENPPPSRPSDTEMLDFCLKLHLKINDQMKVSYLPETRGGLQTAMQNEKEGK